MTTLRLLALISVALLSATSVYAQIRDSQRTEPETPAFTLSSSEVFTSRDSAAFNLTFRRVTQLDFRVYRGKDPFAFFAGLRDPHQTAAKRSSPTRAQFTVPLADWKAVSAVAFAGSSRAR